MFSPACNRPQLDLFPIPMRGNEGRNSRQQRPVAPVSNPHEG